MTQRIQRAYRQNVSLYLFLRLVLLYSVVFTGVLFRLNQFFSSETYLAVMALCAFSSALTLSFVVLRDRAEDVSYFQVSQVAFDILFTSALIYYTGPADSVYVIFYLVNIMFTAVLINGYAALVSAIVSGSLYFILVYLSSEKLSAERSYLMMTTETSFIVVALLTGQLMDEVRKNRARIGRLEELSSDIVDSLDAGLIGLDRGSRIVRTNKVARAILRFRSEEFDQHSLDEVFPEFAHASSNEVRDVELGEDRRRFLMSRVVLGEDLSFLIFRDITEILGLQDRLRSQEHLANIGQLSASLAHEIRNPLASISGAAQVLTHSNISKEDQARLTTIMLKEIERVDLLIVQLLRFARPEVIQKKPVKLRLLLQEAVGSIEARQDTRDMNVQVSFVEGRKESQFDPCVEGDAEQLREVFSNILVNALQALSSSDRPNKRIEIQMKSLGSFVEVRVSDNGPGIPKEHRSKVFNPFFTTKEGGTGLGLARVHKIVTDHEGRISLETSVKEEGLGSNPGTTFFVHLPLTS